MVASIVGEMNVPTAYLFAHTGTRNINKKTRQSMDQLTNCILEGIAETYAAVNARAVPKVKSVAVISNLALLGNQYPISQSV
jgi:hypothetical protein